MKNFKAILSNILYAEVVILLVIALVIAKQYLINSNRNAPLCLPKANTVILGDSHARHGLNPDKIDNSISVSQDSQNIIYSYYVLKKLFDSGYQYQNVVLSYSYHSLGKFYVDLVALEMMRRYHLILDEEFYSNLRHEDVKSPEIISRFYYDFMMLPVGLSNDLSENCSLYLSIEKRHPYIGDFEQNPKPKLRDLSDSAFVSLLGKADKKQSNLYKFGLLDYKQRKQLSREIKKAKYLKTTLERHYNNGSTTIIIVQYLEKISDLCARNHARLFLVNTPIHKAYTAGIPLSTMISVDSLAMEMEKKYNTNYINLSGYPLADKYFYDYDHLTTPGADIVSDIVNKTIRDKQKAIR